MARAPSRSFHCTQVGLAIAVAIGLTEHAADTFATAAKSYPGGLAPASEHSAEPSSSGLRSPTPSAHGAAVPSAKPGARAKVANPSGGAVLLGVLMAHAITVSAVRNEARKAKHLRTAPRRGWTVCTVAPLPRTDTCMGMREQDQCGIRMKTLSSDVQRSAVATASSALALSSTPPPPWTRDACPPVATADLSSMLSARDTELPHSQNPFVAAPSCRGSAASFVGGSRRSQGRGSARSSGPSCCQASRRSIGAKLQQRPEVEVPGASFDASRLRRQIQLGLRLLSCRMRAECGREAKAPLAGNGLTSRSGVLILAEELSRMRLQKT